jgi:hypothetical protein
MSESTGKKWEIAGTLIGLTACVAIGLQIIRLSQTGNAVSLSVLNLFLFVGIYGFWAGYGFRFKRFAVWSTNSLACLLQIVLLVLYFVLLK